MSGRNTYRRGVAADFEFYDALHYVTKHGFLSHAWAGRPADNWFFLMLDIQSSKSRKIAEALVPNRIGASTSQTDTMSIISGNACGVSTGNACNRITANVEDLCFNPNRRWAVILLQDSWLDRYRPGKDDTVREVISRFDRDKLLRPDSVPLIGMSLGGAGSRIWTMIYHSCGHPL